MAEGQVTGALPRVANTFFFNQPAARGHHPNYYTFDAPQKFPLEPFCRAGNLRAPRSTPQQR